MKEEEKVKDQHKSLSNIQVASIVATAAGVVLLWGLNWYLLVDKVDSTTGGGRGTFGDMFGAVNSLFSGLAFGGIIWTILLQRNELRLQREESSLARREAIDQNITLRLQRFEHTFFNMLNLQNEIVKNLNFQELSGRQVIEIAQKQLFTFLGPDNFREVHNAEPHDQVALLDNPTSSSNARLLLDSYYHKRFYNRFSSNFNHYYRHFYHIFKFIYFSHLKKDEKNFYASLARASFSQPELYLLAFNMLIDDYGKPNFLYLIREYDILQNFDWAQVRPLPYKELIDFELKNLTYPFKQAKPENTNY